MVEEEVEADVEIKTTADKFYLFSRRSQNVVSATRYIQGCDLLEGEWDKVGSIIFWKLVFDGEPRVSKDRIETVDMEKNVIQWRVLEGPLKKEYKSFLKTVKVSPKQGGSGSVVKWNMKYERIDEKVAHPKRLLQFFVEVIKEVDRYLLSEE
ncbi:Bet v I/Major latex protein [Arabidopsis thaliana x Arabidopsis arenosa]|uniref:Bet v I/Major latex protein n=1 Tax=Arabidopsis thaliana x Arabidopsis arenosa TaxID=1240361 RepID=A0A8T2CFC4_9BRAS|nr:Bet v I/Major latex protein [Arabidopsis thaliana x Arabidopsis arenosa]